MKLFILFLLFISGVVRADGTMLNSVGRFPEGKSTVIKLTEHQAHFIDRWYRCGADNDFTPYVFILNEDQRRVVKSDTGLYLTRFAITSSFNGDRFVELDTNIINRFSRLAAEIPHKLLSSKADAEHWEFEIMGWKKLNIGVRPCI